MSNNEERKLLFACKQANGRYRKQIENSGVFISGIWEMLDYVAQQPSGLWQAFDEKPVLTETGWQSYGDRPDNLTAEGSLNLHWSLTLCKNDRYKHALTRVRRTLRVRFPS